MRDYRQFYINGEWVDPVTPNDFDVINPANEEVCGKISLGSEEDVDRAVRAARAAFDSYSRTSRQERLELLVDTRIDGANLYDCIFSYLRFGN